MTTSPLPQSNVARGVVALRERILSGELAPGQPLREVRLAAQLGMSRNTLRAALLSLASEGIVHHEPNRGASVVQLGVEDARDIYRVRRLVEVAASGNAAVAPLPARHDLSDAFTGLAQAAQLGSLDQLVHADLVFHRRLVALLDSRRLSGLFGALEAQLRLAFSIVAFADGEHEQPETLVAEHRLLHDLILAGDTTRGTSALLEHLAKYESRLIAVLTERT